MGTYALTGGELAACVLIDCVGRLVAGVLADAVCHEEESIVGGLLEYPQYTRPENFRGREVPAVLLEGNHREYPEMALSEGAGADEEKKAGFALKPA